MRFDPTLRTDGGANPFGLNAFTPYRLEVRSISETPDVVHSIDDDPVTRGTRVDFTTGNTYLFETQPPSVLGVRFLPGPDELTGNIPANALMAVDFDEAMDPTTFVLSRDVLTSRATFDVRYNGTSGVNLTNGVDGRVIPGRITWTADARTFFFEPFFSFGNKKFEFDVSLLAGLQDLAGNQLLNPRAFGSFRCDGNGGSIGTVLDEDFFTPDDRDGQVSDADWGSTEPGVCRGQPITTREAYISSYTFADQPNDSGRGQYVPDANPLIGASINQAVQNLNPGFEPRPPRHVVLLGRRAGTGRNDHGPVVGTGQQRDLRVDLPRRLDPGGVQAHDGPQPGVQPSRRTSGTYRPSCTAARTR